ncbi:MAG: hypothetical protein ABIP53_01265 [Candidatus Limnocylindrales bacterium]
MRAGIAALEGRWVESLAIYRDALRDWRAGHAVWDEALTGLDMAILLDAPEPDVAAVIESTREILGRLGARPYLERMEAAISRATAPALPRSANAPVPAAT